MLECFHNHYWHIIILDHVTLFSPTITTFIFLVACDYLINLVEIVASMTSFKYFQP